MLELGLKSLLAYLLGSVSGSLLVGRLFGGVDIRREGSGNAGATNALRTHGLAFALPVVLIDIGKGWLAVTLIPALAFVAVDPDVPRAHLGACCGVAAVLGHIWPFWHGFRGGKGAATLVGTYLALAPAIVPWLLALWIVGIVATGYVGLSTMLAALFVPIYAAFGVPASATLLGYSLFMALLIVFAHRENVARLRNGTENRMTRAMFWRRQDSP